MYLRIFSLLISAFFFLCSAYERGFRTAFIHPQHNLHNNMTLAYRGLCAKRNEAQTLQQQESERGDMSTDQQETVQRSKHQRAVVQLASTSTKSR